MTAHSVVCENVGVSYGRFAALTGVTVAFGEGITGILGPNGAGKSTLLRCIVTAQWPTVGRVLIDGLATDESKNVRAVRRKFGYMSQSPTFYPSFTAARFLDYMALLKEVTDHDERTHLVEKALAAVGLTDRAKSRINTLSGGMKQRLSLAQAILTSPPLLVLDEPAAGLDPQERSRFRDILLSAGGTVLLATHLTDDVALVCDKVAVLVGGSIHFLGSVADLIGLAYQRVWISDFPDPASQSWRTSDGRFRCIGNPPPNVQLAAPTVEDGYMMVLNRDNDE